MSFLIIILLRKRELIALFNCVLVVVWLLVQTNLCKTATLKKTKSGFEDYSWLNAGQKYCRMIQGEHSAILSTFIKLPFVIKIFVVFNFEWPFYTGFT